MRARRGDAGNFMGATAASPAAREPGQGSARRGVCSRLVPARSSRGHPISRTPRLTAFCWKSIRAETRLWKHLSRAAARPPWRVAPFRAGSATPAPVLRPASSSRVWQRLRNACDHPCMNARELTNQLAALLRTEQSAMADFLLALADFDRKELWRDLGHTSFFYFLRRELGLSAGAAQYRKTAAELIQRFREVEVALREGRLCLSTVVEVAKVLTPENRGEVLPQFFGLSRREAEMVAVSIRPVEAAPRREVVTTIRAGAAATPPLVRAARPASAVEPAALELRPAETPAVAANTPMAAPETSVPPCRDSVEPLDAKRSRWHVTVSRRFLEKLEAAKDALSHAHPGASAEEVLEAGLDLLLAKDAKRKGLVAKPQKTVRPSNTDAVPANVKRAVWKRAGGRCEWRFASGERCGSTVRLELDHVHPRARGGPSTIENIRLHCRPHNDMAARLAFGDEWMDRYTRKRGRGGSGGPPAP